MSHCGSEKIVREFRHMLMWPLQLRRLPPETGFAHHWEALAAKPGPWIPVQDNLLIFLAVFIPTTLY